MASAIQDVFVDLLNRRFTQGVRGGEWVFPVPFHTDNLGLRFRFGVGNYGGDLYNPLTHVSISGAALTVTVYKADFTVLASTSTFTADTTQNTLTGTLNLYTAAMITAMASVTVPAKLTTYLEIVLLLADSTQWVHRVDSFQIAKAITTGAIVAPSPSDVYLTQAQMDARYLKKLSDAGDTWTTKSPDGTKTRILGVRNDGSAQDDIA